MLGRQVGNMFAAVMHERHVDNVSATDVYARKVGSILDNRQGRSQAQAALIRANGKEQCQPAAY